MYKLKHAMGKKSLRLTAWLMKSIKQTGLTYSSYELCRICWLQRPTVDTTQKQIADEWLLPKQTIFNACR